MGIPLLEPLFDEPRRKDEKLKSIQRIESGIQQWLRVSLWRDEPLVRACVCVWAGDMMTLERRRLTQVHTFFKRREQGCLQSGSLFHQAHQHLSLSKPQKISSTSWERPSPSSMTWCLIDSCQSRWFDDTIKISNERKAAIQKCIKDDARRLSPSNIPDATVSCDS